MFDLQSQDKELLKTFLDYYYFPPKAKTGKNLPDNLEILPDDFKHNVYVTHRPLELILRSECNLRCEYCYLTQHGKELYPPEVHAPKNTILKNLKILLDFFIEHQIFNNRFDLFAGDMFYDDLFFDVCDIIFDYFMYWKEKLPEYFQKKPHRSEIIFPVNFSFINDDKKTQRCIEYYDKFNAENIDFGFSWSHDGPYSTARKGEKINEEWYDKAFKFAKRIKAGLHPMVSAIDIDYAIQNYDWWLEKIKEYNIDEDYDFQPMLLEVRNNDWTEEKIQKYLDFLQHIITKRLEICHNDVSTFTYHMFQHEDNLLDINPLNGNTIPKKLNHYDPIALYLTSEATAKDELGCGFSTHFFIRLADMAIVPCHRLTYSQFIGGYFVIEDDKIVDLKPHNVSTYLSMSTLKMTVAPKCVVCDVRDVCLKGCLGSQYEYSGEYLLPIPSVCNLYRTKNLFLINVYAQLGVLKCVEELELIPDYQINIIKNLCNTMGVDFYGIEKK